MGSTEPSLPEVAATGELLREWVPLSLREPAPLGLERWQWLAVPVLLVVSALLGVLAAWLFGLLLRRFTARTAVRWDDALAERLVGPLRLLCFSAAFGLVLPALALPPGAASGAATAAKVVAAVAVVWGVFRAVSLTVAQLTGSEWVRSRPGSRALISLGGQLGRVAVVAAGAAMVLTALGYPVASLIAGLGLGGLAFALAAQKTLENLFGALALAVDQPFREGDFVKVDDFVGTVETIGMRSTRFRTLDRTLITLPNGKLADTRIETFAARDRIRLACTLGLVYSTRAPQLRAVLEGLEAVLRGHPRIWPDAVVVRFAKLSDSSLDIEVMAWFLTTDFGEFQAIRQEVLLSFMEVVERSGTSFAFPTRTVHLAP